jgi:hypothetical protein
MTADAFAFGWGANDMPGPPVYPPATISGLVLALETDLGLSGSSWTDQSTQGNNATIVGSPGAGTTINGKATLRLNAGTKYIEVASAASLNWGNAGFDVFLVGVRQSGGGGFQAAWSKTISNAANFSGFIHDATGGQLTIFYSDASLTYVQSSLTSSTGTAAVLEWGADGGGSGGNVRYAFGSTKETDAQDNTLGTGSNSSVFRIGTDGSFPAMIDVAGIFAYKPGLLSTGDRASLISYINGKYGSIG